MTCAEEQREHYEKKDNPAANCLNVKYLINFLKSGGSMVTYDSKKIRGELQLFSKALQELSVKMQY